MSSPLPSVTVRSGTAPRKPGGYCSDSGETFIRGDGDDRVAAIVKRFLFLAAVEVVWNPVKVGGAKSKCLGRRREEWHGVRRSVEVSMVSIARNGHRESDTERERGVLSFESFDFGFCVFIVCRGSRVVWSGGVFVGAYDK